MIKRFRIRRRWLVASVLAVAVVAAGGAYAGHQDSGVTSYTGCLNTGGDASGVILHVKTGNNPAKPCGSNQVQIHLSGGDITAVRTPTSSGLTGGSENGAVTLGLTAQQLLPSCSAGRVPGWNGSMWVCYSAGTGLAADTAGNNWNLASSYRLPQSCSDGQVAKDSGTTWVCGNDNDTTYSAGTGLDLSVGNELSVEPSYRLPQGCSIDRIAKWDGSDWVCADDNVGLLTVFTAFGGVALDGASTQHEVVNKQVPAGKYLISFVGRIGNFDDDPQNGDCELRPAPADQSVFVRMFGAPSVGNQGVASMALLDTAEFGGTTTISVWCRSFDGRADGTLTALRVGSIG